jgi:hypothetical protein
LIFALCHQTPNQWHSNWKWKEDFYIYEQEEKFELNQQMLNQEEIPFVLQMVNFDLFAAFSWFD